ncbi:MAG TPA: GGDEF domain-containing protein [Longimicrobiales bacterium]|nr:GGDEF domain-containing protein [Longimicrobiales bacterium]
MTEGPGAGEGGAQGVLTPRHVPFFMLAVLILVFLLSIAWEFFLEEGVLTFFGVENSAEPTREHWRYIVLVTAFNGIALLAPGWALHRALTRRARMEAEIRRLASHDGLTGLPNRGLFMDRLGQALRRARRDGTQVAVMFLDLDDFKSINDSLGHGRGDTVLRAVADRLSACLRGTDTVARFGGDEFVIVMTDVGDRDDVVAMAEKLVLTVLQPIPVGGCEASVHASIGIALYPGDAREPEALLTGADRAMYQAKRQGTGRYRFTDACP